MKKVTANGVIDGLIVGVMIAAVALVIIALAGCASTPDIGWCVRCGDSFTELQEYAPHGNSEVTSLVCDECADWLARKIGRAASEAERNLGE